MKTYLRLLRFLKPYIWPHFVHGMVCMLTYVRLERRREAIIPAAKAANADAFITALTPSVLLFLQSGPHRRLRHELAFFAARLRVGKPI